MVLRNMRIGTRLAVGFGSILAILMVAGHRDHGDEQAQPRRAHRRPRVRGRQADAGRRDEVPRARAVERHAQHRPALRHQGDAAGRGPRPRDRQGVRRGDAEDAGPRGPAGGARRPGKPRQARQGAGRAVPAGPGPVDQLPQRGGREGPHDGARPARPEVDGRAHQAHRYPEAGQRRGRPRGHRGGPAARDASPTPSARSSWSSPCWSRGPPRAASRRPWRNPWAWPAAWPPGTSPPG